MMEKICCATGSWPRECCLCSRMGPSLAGWQRHRRKEGGRKEGRKEGRENKSRPKAAAAAAHRLASYPYSNHVRGLNK